jgi:hypothetical protein
MFKIGNILSAIVSIIFIIVIFAFIILLLIYYNSSIHCSNYYNSKLYKKLNIDPWYENDGKIFPYNDFENNHESWKSLAIELEPLSKYNEKIQTNKFKDLFYQYLFQESQSSQLKENHMKELLWKDKGLVQIISPKPLPFKIDWINSSDIVKVSFLFPKNESSFQLPTIIGCLIYGILLKGENIKFGNPELTSIKDPFNLNKDTDKDKNIIQFKNNGIGFILRSDVPIQMEKDSIVLFIHFIPRNNSHTLSKLNIPISRVLHIVNKKIK